jgi:hypothetical protein
MATFNPLGIPTEFTTGYSFEVPVEFAATQERLVPSVATLEQEFDMYLGVNDMAAPTYEAVLCDMQAEALESHLLDYVGDVEVDELDLFKDAASYFAKRGVNIFRRLHPTDETNNQKIQASAVTPQALIDAYQYALIGDQLGSPTLVLTAVQMYNAHFHAQHRANTAQAELASIEVLTPPVLTVIQGGASNTAAS